MPLVNGCEFAFDCLDLRVNGQSVDYVDSVSWSDDCAVSDIRGTGGRLVDFIPGNYSARGSITLAKTREADFLDAIGVLATLCVPFTFTVTALVEGRTPVSEVLDDVVLIGRRESHSSRSGVLVVSFDFRARAIRTNRRLPLA